MTAAGMVPASQIGMILMNAFEIFLAAYVEAMLWSTSGTDQHGEEVESLEVTRNGWKAEDLLLLPKEGEIKRGNTK